MPVVEARWRPGVRSISSRPSVFAAAPPAIQYGRAGGNLWRHRLRTSCSVAGAGGGGPARRPGPRGRTCRRRSRGRRDALAARAPCPAAPPGVLRNDVLDAVRRLLRAGRTEVADVRAGLVVVGGERPRIDPDALQPGGLDVRHQRRLGGEVFPGAQTPSIGGSVPLGTAVPGEPQLRARQLDKVGVLHHDPERTRGAPYLMAADGVAEGRV